MYKQNQRRFKKRKQCCFHFPRPLSLESGLLTDDEAERASRIVISKPAAGKEFVHNYNADLLAAWQANMDLSPVGIIGELV